MTDITTTAVAAREDARRANGEFGTQTHSQPEIAILANGTPGEQAIDQITQGLHNDWHALQIERRELFAEVPAVIADTLAEVAPKTQSVRFEFTRAAGEQTVQARATAFTIDGEQKRVDWETPLDELTGDERERRMLALSIENQTRYLVEEPGDLEVHGFSGRYDPADDTDYFQLSVAGNATGRSAMDALTRGAQLTGTAWAAQDIFTRKRHTALTELKQHLPTLLDEWAPGAEEVTFQWDATAVSADSPAMYRPEPLLASIINGDGSERRLVHEADDLQDHDTYRAEAAGGWVNELLAVAVQDQDDFTQLGAARVSDSHGLPTYRLRLRD